MEQLISLDIFKVSNVSVANMKMLYINFVLLIEALSLLLSYFINFLRFCTILSVVLLKQGSKSSNSPFTLKYGSNTSNWFRKFALISSHNPCFND